MLRKEYYYLFEIQYLGFRYHGWQKQPGVKSIQKALEKVFRYALGTDEFKLLACGRTDAGVSARQSYIEVFTRAPADFQQLTLLLNEKVAQDIRLHFVREVDATFNIIKQVESKEYRYYFSFGEKAHPFTAPFCQHWSGNLDLPRMQAACALFVGTHNFAAFCNKPKEETQWVRAVDSMEIQTGSRFEAEIWGKNSYYLQVKGKGFLRHQIRLMMGALVLLGQGEISEEAIRESLLSGKPVFKAYTAPGHGLELHSVKMSL
ncbi:tRNA pseudouridine(38-40) synthase TruA [Cytophagales bacterium LB-30]|uniref:tRNA pseudouridine synthase A n=1 Tax=Shiella aurantiaca TaxID=3058365 RepID=A0ABT8F3S9_9BACT|nr:tRNA pseudouridine(38-40) synthase TruA [Shiella aurantiaca]MDN4165118.1 tRNA pseudouridine(38-40) synthase TruA [Shiella aurantiaca]